MLIRRFLRNRDGSVAPLLAFAALPLLGFVGAAVDYSRAASVRASMQAALDATALTLAKEVQNLNVLDLTQKANDSFKATFTRPEASNVEVAAQLSIPQAGNYSLRVTASATVKALFTNLIGQSQIQLSAESEAVWGIKKLNLALVLDNTGSMASDNKMLNLKVAAHGLLATLQSAAKTPGDIKVAIVPFTTDVNVGSGFVNASWIDWTDWEAVNGTCSKSSYHTKSSCTSNGKIWIPASHVKWNGCVNDRDQNNDVSNVAPVPGAPATLFRAHQASGCPAAMMPLGYDWAAMNAKIDAMTPNGATNVTIGLAWGFQLLSPVEPFNAPAPSTDLEKVIVLLTDGENTRNRWTSTSSAIDLRTAKVCDNIKAANIAIYTVRVIEGNAALLQYCASKPSMYFDVQDAAQLSGVFKSIAQKLANLRISK